MPARVEPVNEIMSISGCSLMAAPTSGPRPLIRLNTPFGTPASCRISAQRHALLAAGLRKRLEGAARGGHRLVDVGPGAERNFIHRLFGRRVDDRRGFLDDRIDPGAIDVELHAVDHREPLDVRSKG